MGAKKGAVARLALVVSPEQGRKATDAELRTAEAQIRALLIAIEPLNVPAAGEVVQERLRTGELSPQAIAWLAYWAADRFMRARARHNARQPRRSSLVEQIRRAGVQSYAEAKEKVPELFARYNRRQLTDAISKAKRGRKSP
jgi:hypothetical protein